MLSPFRSLVMLGASFFAFSSQSSAEELCDWFPSGPRGESKTYLCVEKISSSSGLISIRTPHGSRTCDAKVRGTTWVSNCKISTDIEFDGLTIFKENSTIEFSVMTRPNPETGRAAATLDFHKPEHGINGWKRWYLNAN